MKGDRYVRMDQAGGEAGGGGAAAAAPATAPATGGDVGAGGAAPLLAAGAQAAAGVTWLPDQYVVKDDKGTVVLEASAKKLADAHKDLVAKMRDTGLPPKSPDEYKAVVPEGVKYDPAADPKFAEFRKQAHELGLSQKQFDGVVGRFFALLPEMRATAVNGDEAAARAELSKVWTTPEAMSQNLGYAFHAAKTLAGDRFDAVMEKFGNDPDFLRMLAKVGPELREDKSPGRALGVNTAYQGMTSQQLMQHEAYTNQKHSDHALVSQLVRQAYEQKYGNGVAL